MKAMRIITFLMIILFFTPLSLAAPDSMPKLKKDTYYMRLLIKLAKKNPKLPFAAMIVNKSNGDILCTGINRVKPNGNPVWTAEIDAIDKCASKLPTIKWHNTILYTTAEPDVMSQAAIIRAGISKTIYGTSLQFIRKYGKPPILIHISAKEVINRAQPFYKGTIKGGVLEKQTNQLYLRRLNAR